MTSSAKFLGNTIGEAAAFAAGLAISPVLHPIVQALANEAWSLDPTKPLDATLIAEAVAHGHIAAEDGKAEAALTGVSGARFDSLVKSALTGPGVTSAFALWRRGRITQGEFEGALTRAGIEPEWFAPLEDLKTDRLDTPVVALAIVRGILKDPGFLPVGPPATEGKVRAFPTSDLDPLAEAEAQGIDRERLFVQTAIAGRPMAPIDAAHAVFRAILERVDYDRAIAEGDIRNEWADAIFEAARAIPSPSDYINAHLRGWITEAQMYAGTARHGMSAADTDLLYLRSGRPAAPGQMATAAARGIDGPDGTPMDRAQFLKGIAESDIRPEWGPMLWESRYLYPPLFQLTRLVNAGAIDGETAASWAEKDRYAPEVVDALRTLWKGGTATAADPHVAKAQTQLWTTTHRSYLNGEASATVARNKLAQAGVAAASIPQVLGVWDQERELIRKQLTPAQIKKAVTKQSRNAATGQAWTRDEGIAALVALGYSTTDANDYLDIP